MAMATSAIFCLSSSLPCRLVPPPPRKGKEGSLSLITKRSRLSSSCAGNRMANFALFSSNSDQQPEEAEGAELSDESFLPPDDVDYLWKLVAGSVGGGAVLKYGKISQLPVGPLNNNRIDRYYSFHAASSIFLGSTIPPCLIKHASSYSPFGSKLNQRHSH